MTRRPSAVAVLAHLERSLEELPDVLAVPLAQVTEAPGSLLSLAGLEGKEGTTTVALAAALAVATRLGRRVVLVDAHVRRPRLAEFVPQGGAPGLAEVLRGDLAPEHALVPADVPLLSLLCAGRDPIPAGALGLPGLRTVLAALGATHEVVLVDAGAVLAGPESCQVAVATGRTVLVLRARATRRSGLARAVQLLHSSGVTVPGTILNRYRSEVPSWASFLE